MASDEESRKAEYPRKFSLSTATNIETNNKKQATGNDST